MLELYHSINSVCAQKIRLALNEKKLPYSEHLMKLNGDQFDPAYLKLNPNGVVPTLIHDGQAVTEFGGHSLLSGRGLSGSFADAESADGAHQGPAVQQTDR